MIRKRNGAWHDYRGGRGKMDKLPGGIWRSWFVPRRCEDAADDEFWRGRPAERSLLLQTISELWLYRLTVL